MIKRLSVAFILAFFIGLSTLPATAQDWTLYTSKLFDLQFEIPSYWEVDVDGDVLTAMGDDIVFVLGAVKDNSLSTEEVFQIQLETLNLDMEGEYEEMDLQGGIHAFLGAGAALMDEEVVGMILLSATLDENNYIAYIFATPEAYEENEAVMVDIITSLAPLGWTE